jgi:hypothetical protein
LFFLVLLLLGVLRLTSWGIGWLLSRLLKRTTLAVRLGANLAAFAAFAGYLMFTGLPGESLDFEALAFGAVVYALCFVIDLKWCPWARVGQLR